MERIACNPEEKGTELCPVAAQLGGCREDVHHLGFPRGVYKGIEKKWRDEEFNKVRACVALHRAIHASGYIPEKPERDVMVNEIWLGGQPLRSLVELHFQVQQGEAVLNSPPKDAA